MAARVEARQQGCEDKGGERDPRDEDAAVAMVKAVASFEFVGLGGAETVGVKKTGIEKPVGRVEHPDGDGHGGRCCGRQMDVVGAGDEPGPESGDGGRVEREQMP